MKVLPTLSKKFISLMIAVSMVFVMLSGIVCAASTTVFANPSALAIADGNAYFYFAAPGLSVSAKNGFYVNNNELVYITDDIISHTERIDKTWLTPNAVNTVTIFTGNATGKIDETKSRDEAGADCDEFTLTIAQGTINILLPNGRLAYPTALRAYKPTRADLPLNECSTYDDVKKSINLGDNSLDYYYKVEAEFDLRDIDWDSAGDMTPVLPDIKNVSLQIGAEPSKRNIVWYSTSEEDGVVQLALKSAMTGTEFPSSSATSFNATANVTGLTGYTSYKATMTDLAENTEYVYRVGDGTVWSDTYSFTTQGFDNSFSFLAVSDPQLGQGSRYDDIQDEIDGWTTTLNKAQETLPDAAFLACMGDQVAKTFVNNQFDALFSPEALKTFALAVVPGNHDVGANYTPHFNMPNLTSYGIQSTMGAGSANYWFTYGDALFMTINGMVTDYDGHIQFVEEAIEANPNAKWKFIMVHYGFYGATTQSFDTPLIAQLREALAPEFSRLGIDVVLDGHEHCYSRSYFVNGFTETPNLATGGSSVTDPNPNEVLYLTFNSASGSDFVQPKDLSELPCTAFVHQALVPNFSKIDITDSSFTVNTYRTDTMAVIDTFTINRTTAPVAKSVSIAQKDATVKTGNSQTFDATVYGYNNPSQEVVWSVSGNENANTAINSDGVLSVDIDETADELVVTAAVAGNELKTASVTVSVESSIVDLSNVGQGVTYALPAKVNNVAVTAWKNTAGSVVTTVDTSLAGYRFYTATLADGTAVKCRVNVGEYQVLMSDDLETYDESKYTTGFTAKITGGSFKLGAYQNTANNAQKLVKEGKNTVAAIGTQTSSTTGLTWTPTDKAIGQAFKVSYKVKVASFDLDTAAVGSHYIFRNSLTYANGIQLRVDVAEKNGVKSISATKLYYQGATNATQDISNYVAWTAPDANNVVSMTDYITIDIEGNSVQYSVNVNGHEIVNSFPFKTSDNVATKGIAGFYWAKRTAGTVDTITYADDMVYSKAIYVTDTLKNVPVATSLNVGDDAAQTTTVTLNLSNGTTKNFTVNYTADTTSAGVKKANGNIEGFEDVVPVTYTVTVPTVINSMVSNATGITQVNLQNNVALESGVMLFVAVYDNSETRNLQCVCKVDLNEAQRMAGAQTIALPYTLSAAAGSLVRAFVWNGGLSPLTSVLEMTK